MIAVLGEAIIDMIGGTGVDEQSCFYPHVGGCALNAATAAARLGSEVLYIGNISKDMFGKQINQHFVDNAVHLIPQLCEVPENTMIGFAQLNEQGSASYVFYSDNTTVTNLTAQTLSDVLAEVQHVSYMHIGSVSIALESSGVQILAALESAESLPAIFFDPNVRPTVITNFPAFRERVIALAKLSSVIKLSHEDLELIYPELSLSEAIEAFFSLGVVHLILTKGKDGLQWISRDGLDVSIPAIDNPIVDTVGAGDTVSGAVMTYLEEQHISPDDTLSEDTVRTILSFAARAAAVTTSRKGADPPRRDEIDMFAHLQG
jgi:fructokinase